MRPSITELDWKPRTTGWTPQNFNERRKQRARAYKRAAAKQFDAPPIQPVQLHEVPSQVNKPPSYVRSFLRKAKESQYQAELREMQEKRDAEIKALELHLEQIREEQELIEDAFIKRTLIRDIKFDTYVKYSPYGLQKNDLITARRDWLSCLARFECFYRCRNETGKSYPYIGKHFGGRDHTTVLSGIRRYEQFQTGSMPTKLQQYQHLILPADYLEQEGCEA